MKTQKEKNVEKNRCRRKKLEIKKYRSCDMSKLLRCRNIHIDLLMIHFLWLFIVIDEPIVLFPMR